MIQLLSISNDLSLSRCSTTVESFPTTPAYSSDNVEQTELQKIRVVIGAPLKRPPSNQIVEDPLVPMFSSVDSNTGFPKEGINLGFFQEDKFVRPEGLEDLHIFCTSDFATVAKEVEVRTRRVRLLGLEVTSISFLIGITFHAFIRCM